MKTFVVLCVIFAVAAASAPAGKPEQDKPAEGARNKRNLYSIGYPYVYSAYPAYSYTPQVVSYNSLRHVPKVVNIPHVVNVPSVYHVPEVVSVNHVVHSPTYTASIY